MLTSPGLTRRTLAAGLAWSAPTLARAGERAPALARRLEARVGGRIGYFAFGPHGALRSGWREDERFPMCSTSKLIIAAGALAAADAGRLSLEERIPFGPADLLRYAPATRARAADGGMSVADLCAAAIGVSDNTAANLLIRKLGGPPAVTAFARSLGDPVFRLDRIEPDLNSADPGDIRDTTSPRAMVDDLGALLLGPALSPASRVRLAGWMRDCETGGARIRAGLPEGTDAGDKTGTGDHGSLGDVAFAEARGGRRLHIAVYAAGGAGGPAAEAAIARIAAAVWADFRMSRT